MNGGSIKIIMLIDNNEKNIFTNVLLIKLAYPNSRIVLFRRADCALEFLKEVSVSAEMVFPSLILLNLGIPEVDHGFAFLKEYQTLTKKLLTKPHVQVFSGHLTTSDRLSNLLSFKTKENGVSILSAEKKYKIFAN